VVFQEPVVVIHGSNVRTEACEGSVVAIGVEASTGAFHVPAAEFLGDDPHSPGPVIV
jgi:hypothetical protein